MVKAVLTFTLPEDRQEHLAAISGNDLSMAITEIQSYLRNMYKYETDGMSTSETLLVEKIRDRIEDILDECEIPKDLRY